jgi:MFS family permease
MHRHPVTGNLPSGQTVFEVLRRYRDLRFVLSAQLLSTLGNWMLLVAAPFYVLQVTGSAAASGLTFVAESAPAVLLGPFAGVLVDRMDRRQAMLLADLVRVGSVLLMLLALNPDHLWALFAGLAIGSALSQVNQPARAALLPQIVGRGPDLSRSNALANAGISTVQIVAAPLGGILFVAFGFEVAVMVNAATYALSALLLLRVKRRGIVRLDTSARGLRGVLNDVKGGFVEIRNSRPIRAITTTSSFFMLGNGAVNALLVAYLGQQLNLSAATLGLLFAGLGVTSVLAAPVASQIIDRFAPRVVVTSALMVVAVGFALLFNIPNVPLAITMFLILGPPLVIYGVSADTLVQRNTPDRAMGRVSATYRTANRAASLIGEVGGVSLVVLMGLTATLNLAVAALLVGAMSALLLPRSTYIPEAESESAPREPTIK